MKVPLHYQVSSNDCVPTCFINALMFLFEREEIPTVVVHHIHLYGYDAMGKNYQLGQGTTSNSVQLIGEWLQSYRKNKTDKFKIKHEYLDGGKEVHLRNGNDIEACLEKRGVALCSIYMRTFCHYMLAIKADKDRLFFFDPYLRKKQIAGLKGRVEVLDSDGFGPNLSIARAWLDQTDKKNRFCFGPMDERDALLLWRLS